VSIPCDNLLIGNLLVY